MTNNNYRFLWPSVALIAVPAFLFMHSSTVSGDAVAGWIERVAITDRYFPVHAKLDTGADSSSLNAIDPEIIKVDDDQHIKFKLTNKDNSTILLNRKIIRWTTIKNKFGVTRERPVILMDVCLGTVSRVVEVNLIDRSNYKYQMLIGRNFLNGDPNLLVDSSRKYLHQPSCIK